MPAQIHKCHSLAKQDGAGEVGQNYGRLLRNVFNSAGMPGLRLEMLRDGEARCFFALKLVLGFFFSKGGERGRGRKRTKEKEKRKSKLKPLGLHRHKRNWGGGSQEEIKFPCFSFFQV